MAVPGRLSATEPSPQLTLKEEIVPSESADENATVTVWPTKAGLGETLLIVTIGGRSLTVSDVVPEPGPALLVAVTIIGKV